MEFGKLIFLISITMALSVTLTMNNMVNIEEGGTFSFTNYVVHDHEEDAPQVVPLPPKRVSRFLKESEERNPRAADHCHKDHEVCYTLDGGKNSTCCNNKCVDLTYERHNCGACKKKCEYTETCCHGECVDVAYDKRHCGKCNNKCKHGEYCIYSMCNYA